MTSQPPSSEQDFSSQLTEFSTCDISDALQKLGHVSGGFIAGPVLYSPQHQAGGTRIAGPAYTVKYVSAGDGGTGSKTKTSGGGGHYIDGVPAGAVVLISAPDGTENAVYGGLMSTRARARGAIGTVVDGRVRDLEEHRNLEYPVFARAIGTASPYGEVVVEQINGVIEVGTGKQKVAVKSGDYVVGDLNGVVCVPVQLLAEVLDIMPASVEACARIADDLKNGVSFAEARDRHRGG